MTTTRATLRDDQVLAFLPHPDTGEWHFVARDYDELGAGDVVDGDQCGDCGGPVDENGEPTDWVVSSGCTHLECSCGTKRPIRVKLSDEVIW